MNLWLDASCWRSWRVDAGAEAFRLWSDDAPVDLTGLTLDLVVTDRTGAPVSIDRAQLRKDADQTWDAVTEVCMAAGSST